jgi:hypothetical protein
MTKSLPKQYVFFVFYCCCALKYHAAANFWIGSRESFENGRWFLANVAVNTCQDLATADFIGLFTMFPRGHIRGLCVSLNRSSRQPDTSVTKSIHKNTKHKFKQYSKKAQPRSYFREKMEWQYKLQVVISAMMAWGGGSGCRLHRRQIFSLITENGCWS